MLKTRWTKKIKLSSNYRLTFEEQNEEKSSSKGDMLLSSVFTYVMLCVSYRLAEFAESTREPGRSGAEREPA